MANPLNQAHANWGSAHVLGPDGNPYRPTVPPQPPANTGGGGGPGGEPSMSTRLDRLEQHRTWLWAVTALAFTAIGGSFLFLLTQIDSRFDRVDEPLVTVRETVAKQSAKFESVEDSLARIEAKLDEQN